MNRKMLNKIAMLLIITTLSSLVTSMNMPNVIAVTPWISITPTRGVVGDMVTVNGAINTTDGDFAVRWNQTSTFNGTAVGNNVTISFEVPPITFTPEPYGSNITVELIDRIDDSVVAATNFTLFAPEFHMQIETLPYLKQLQEGNKTNIMINVTGGLPNTRYAANITAKNPANQTHFAVVLLTNTTTTGFGNGTASYPTAFNGAHTNLTGKYIVTSNVTGDYVAEFFVGLTDKTEYLREEIVRIQAAGYKSSEVVNVDIRTSESVSSFPQNVTASSSGLVTLTWKVPINATREKYHVIVTNTTVDGTVKTPSDAQDFEVSGWVCFVEAKNLADEAVEGASIKVYNASAPTTALNEGLTNSTGWIRFNRDEGNYTFRAFFKNVQVGLANKTIIADTTLFMTLNLTNFLATVKTEEDVGVPLIEITLKENATGAQAATGQTNATGVIAIRNLFTNRTYRIEATRYGLLFSNTTVYFPENAGIIHNLTLPNHPLNVHSIDSQDNSAVEVSIKVYEWASGIATPVDSATTNSSGNVFFSLPFGKYILRAFKGTDFLSEAIVDLDEPTTFTFDLVTLNLNVTVSVLDYFGLPLANAEVKIERKIGQDFVLITTKPTDAAGKAQFADMIGGDSRVLVYLEGTLVAVKTQFLGAGSNDVAIKVAEYVAIAGYPLQTGVFALLIFILVLTVVVVVAARKRLMQVFQRSSKK